MEVNGHCKIGRPKQRWTDVIPIRHEGDMSRPTERSTRPENTENENSGADPK